MNPITKEHNEKDINIQLWTSLVFAMLYIVYRHWIYFLGGLVFLGLAMFRKYWLNKRL